jgi:NADPH2:quinone reductase
MAEATAPQGKICSIVESDELLDLTLLKDKSVTFIWEFMFTRLSIKLKIWMNKTVY